MLKVTNPFPQLGTPTPNLRIDPVGYDNKIESIKRMVTRDGGIQPLIINIYGEYGQGKTTFLKFLKEKFSGEWANLSVFEKNISDFPDLENDLVMAQKEHQNAGTDGIFYILDEMQHIATDKKILSDKQNNFLNVLRAFADDTIDGVNSEKFILCIGMHPETKVFLDKYGHLDVSQRIKSFSVNLKDMDYYMAYMLVNEHLNRTNNPELSLKNCFDESFINAFYILLSHIDEQKDRMKRQYGRTYAQTFYQLFDFYTKKGLKLTFDDLKDILLGKHEIELADVQITLPNIDLYYEKREDLALSEEKIIFDWFLFNPKWHLEHQLEKIDIYYLDNLIKKGYISERKGIIISPKQFNEINNRIRDELRTLESVRVYINGEKTIYFIDTADSNLINNLDFKIQKFYRLKDDLLTLIYDFHPPESVTDKLIEYFNLESSSKINQILELIKERSNIETFNEVKIKECQYGVKYKYLEILFKLRGEIKHKVGLFYYADKYANSEFEKFFIDVQKELEINVCELAIIFICPYFNEELPKELVPIRKMENRLFINHISKDELILLLDGDLDYIGYNIRESIKLYTQEAVKLGFTMPLTGFKQKIINKPSLFRDRFLEDIKTSWRIQLNRNAGEETKEKPLIFNPGSFNPGKGQKIKKFKSPIDGDGKLINLARESLSEFVQLDDYNFIIGAKLSKYEKNFLELFGTNKVDISEIEKTKEKYFSFYSRFDVEEYITKILEIKSILKIEDDKYVLLQPSDYLKDIFNYLNSLDIFELVRKDQNINIKRSIFDLKLLSDKLNKSMDPLQRGYYNSEMKRIENRIKSLEGNEPNLVADITKKHSDIIEKLKTTFGDASIQNIQISKYVKNMEKKSIIKDLYIKNNSKLSNLKIGNIKSYIASILEFSIDYDIDKELLFVLEEIIDKIKDQDSDKNVKSLKNKIIELKNIETVNDSKSILNSLDRLFKKSKTDFSKSQLKNIYQILNDIEIEVIDVIINRLNKAKHTYNDFKTLKTKLKDYNTLFKNLNAFTRRDKYLDNVNSLDVRPMDLENEIENVSKITKYNLDILDDYLGFIYKNYVKEGEIEKIIEIENKIKTKEKKSILEYLEYISNLNSLDYIANYIKMYFDKENIPESELENIISDIKSSEQDMDSKTPKDIINNELLPKEYLRRLTRFEEFYKNGEYNENKTIEYTINNGVV